MAGMDHSSMHQHGMAGMTMPPPRPEPASLAAEPGQPAGTLQPDDIDRPVPTSVEEAARSEAISAEMAGGGGHSMSHGTYKHMDAGRDDAASPEGGHQHHQTPKPKPSPSPGSPHEHHHPDASAGEVPPSSSGQGGQ
jgi:hypothetical protein